MEITVDKLYANVKLGLILVGEDLNWMDKEIRKVARKWSKRPELCEERKTLLNNWPIVKSRLNDEGWN